MKLTPVAFDTETHLIAPKLLAPPIVCLTNSGLDEGTAEIVVNADLAGMEKHINRLFDDESIQLIGHNAPYDLAVIAAKFPYLLPKIFELLQEGRIHDTSVREKLINLTAYGRIAKMENSMGVVVDIKYSLMALCMEHYGWDLSADKEGDDIWRLNYYKLDGVPLKDWPKEAIDYALGDSWHTAMVWDAQEKLRAECIESLEVDPFATQEFRLMTKFVLHLMSCWGFALDPEEKDKVQTQIAELLKPEFLELLIENKILIPATEPMPYANGSKEHEEFCDKKDCDCPPKMKAGKKEKISKKTFVAYIEAVAKEKGLVLRYNDPTDRNPDGSLSTDANFLEENWQRDEVIAQYRHRQAVQKLVTTEFPRMEWEGENADVVHPNYDELKETGRTSSYGGGKRPLYPATNIQNIDPRVRSCYIARPGYVLLSCDYSGMELCTLAQTVINMFGQSVLADLINAGGDAHAYLGAQLAYNLDEEFRQSCDEEGHSTPEELYRAFKVCNCDDADLKKFYKHYRTFAKPTGLGYPGGLGAETFCTYAKGTFGIDVDEATAENLKEIWLETYPEMVQYFDFIKGGGRDDPNYEDHFCYTSPLGMYRANCSYCACANGMGLQTPGAEGALLGLINVVRACYDPTMGYDLLLPDKDGITVRPVAFIHDEIISEIREDDLMHERAYLVSELMCEGMKIITPDVIAKSEPALMRRWNKGAETVLDDAGRLVIWEG